MKIFKELKKLGYKHYTEFTIEELDDLPLNSEERIMEQALVLRWFREKYDIDCYIDKNSVGTYYCKIRYDNMQIFDECHNVTYEKAEQACLDKLIEICKTKTNG